MKPHYATNTLVSTLLTFIIYSMIFLLSVMISDIAFIKCYLIGIFRFPVLVRFTPKWEKEVNFNVMCNIKRKMVPLTLNVKAEGYSMNCLVLLEDSAGNRVELSNSCRNPVNFGRVSC